MSAIAFDTLKYAKRLKEAGVPEKQAEAEAEALVEVLQTNLGLLSSKTDIKEMDVNLRREMKEMELALRRDMKEMEANLKRDLDESHTSLQRDMKELENNLKRDIKEMELLLKRDMVELEQRLVIKLGGMMVVAVGVVAALVKLL